MKLQLTLVLVLLSVFLESVQASASVTSAYAAHSSQPSSSSNPTCPYRTINYITHTLPQQCLTSSWRGTLSTLSTNATGSTSTVQGSSASQDIVLDSWTGSSSQSPLATGSQIEALNAGATYSATSLSSNRLTELPSASPPAAPSEEVDEPSPLEDDKFMSYEEWKKQNLHKAGQSEHLGRDKVEPQVQRKRPVNIHTALDSLGDDAEIDLDFSGLIPDGPELASATASAASGESQSTQTHPEAASTPGVRSKSKDAGTTSRERFNYASFDCAANILKTNIEATSAGSVLGENKDSYMLNVCSANNKFLILELCDDISIDTIVLANFEFFSSIFRTFQVSVSDRYPVKIDKWKTLGTFEARNTRDVQAFLVENPIIWARYMRIEFLTHYGNEYYCPVSLVRVHGTTMLQEYKRDAESLSSSEDDESEVTATGIPSVESLVSETTAAPVLEGQREELSRQSEQYLSSPSSSGEKIAPSIPAVSTSLPQLTTNLTTSATNERPVRSVYSSVQSVLFSSPASVEVCLASAAPSGINTTSSTAGESKVTSPFNAPATISSQRSNPSRHASKSSVVSTNATNTASPQSTVKVEPPSKSQALSGSSSSINATATDRQKSTSTSTQSQAAAPTMQESFFKSVQKRLQMLEANSSLSLQYIEDQSRALRDAFNKVEQRQLAKTTTFLDYLNTTVLRELRDFRQQYDQLWQSTVIELEIQRERYQQENAAMNARLGILADELIFHKRISILQMVLILICLALVLFAKGILNQYLEIPAVQRVLARSPSNRWLNLSNFDTPTQSPPVTRQSSVGKRQGILKGHRRVQSEDSIDDSLSPNDIYPTPPSPTSMSYGEQSDPEHVREDKPLLEDPEFDPSMIERPSTSPPILPSEVSSSPELHRLREGESIDSRITTGLSSPTASPKTYADLPLPRLVVDQATTERHPKHLTWKLPDS